MSLFYKTLNWPERRRPQLSQWSVKRRLRGGGGRKLESLRFPSSSSAPAPGSGGESHSKQWLVATVTRARCSAWSHHRRRRSPSHPDILHSGFKYRGIEENWKDMILLWIQSTRPIPLHLGPMVDVRRGVRDCLGLRMSQHQSLLSVAWFFTLCYL